MNFDTMRRELKSFYWNNYNIDNAKAFAQKCFTLLDEAVTPDLSVTGQKMLQHRLITEEFQPVIFPHCPFYYESGILVSLSDGSRTAKNCGFMQANGWVFNRNKERFVAQDPALWEKTQRQRDALLYLICGYYNDASQHFNFNNRPILEGGLKSIYEKAQKQLPKAATAEQREFLESVCNAMLCLKQAAEKFSQKAAQLALTETDPEALENLRRIALSAASAPWEKPANFYEALNTLAFMRTMLGTLEGIGPNTFGRLDLDLLPFYEADVTAGTLTKEEAYRLICQFLLAWDLHYDHDMPMVSYADHELENSYTLGGCDREGNPVWNDLTQMFLQATREENIIFPKIKCRFSKESPKAYLDEINRAIIAGTSTVLYQNDDACIPAILRSGRPLSEARDYMVTGCWGIASNGTEKYDHGCYVNLLKPLEYAVHHLSDQMEQVGIQFKFYDDARDFEEFYRITLENCAALLRERMEITRKGSHIWHQVDVLPIFSATMEGCIEKMEDFTKSRGKYRDDYLLCFGLPNIVDSLMAIKTLVYDEKKYTLQQYLTAVRNNWDDAPKLRAEVLCCSGWGDGEDASCALANRFNNDLYEICASITGTYGGKVHMGHLTYTEIRWWGEKTLATPDGRRSGDYFSQGLTPSRLKKLPSVTTVINSLAALDASTMAANNVVNVILPAAHISLPICEAFLRAVADSAVMSLQLNCTTKAQLLDAQKHPEKYPDLIVRVCGFSAKFTSLSKEWQEEVLSRNFYE